MKRINRYLAIFLAMLMLFGTMPTQTAMAKKSAKKATKVTKVALNVSQYVMKKGEKLKLKATVTPKKAKVSKISWKSSNKKIAVVSKKGVVKATGKKGKAIITVKVGSKKASCKIIIGTAVKSIVAPDMELTVGGSDKINAVVMPKNATIGTLAYKSEDSSIVSVDKNGNIKAIKVGSVKVSITATDCYKVKTTINVRVSDGTSTTVGPVVIPDQLASHAPVNTQIPPSHTDNPPVNTEKPSVNTEEPPINTQAPPSHTDKPPINTEKPPVNTEEPPVNTQAPPSHTDKPPINTEKPPVNTEKPPVNTQAPPSHTDNPPVNTEKPPAFSMGFVEKEMSIAIGGVRNATLSFTPESAVVNNDVIWSSTDASVAAVISSDGNVQALTPGTATITATSKQDKRVKASLRVTVTGIGSKSVKASSEQELLSKLAGAEDDTDMILTLETLESEVKIPAGDYGNVTLVVEAPNASIENNAMFKNIIIKKIAADTWIEKYGNRIFIDTSAAHIVAESEKKSNVFCLDAAESITVDANKNLQSLLIASAAKVLVKGDSYASRVDLTYLGTESKGRIETYVPLDIVSTTTFELVVGPGGEQTAVKIDREDNIPQISGLGKISITVDSTGRKTDVIAGYTEDLENIPTTDVLGVVKKDSVVAGTATEANVYLVRYYEEMNDKDISIYLDGGSTKKTKTDNEGKFSFKDVSLGNYVVVVETDGYSLITQNIYIDSSYGEKFAYTMDDITLISTVGKVGSITGILTDASTGKAITKGLSITLRKGMNNITANETASVMSDDEGRYSFGGIAPGQYTLQVTDNADGTEYISVYENVSVLPEATVTKNITLTKALDTDEVRFVLSWGSKESGASKDLDVYLYGPNPFAHGEYNMSFPNQMYSRYEYMMDGTIKNVASLDVDDTEYDGPETITVRTVTDGQYKVFVHDYSGDETTLYASNPVIKVYKGTNLISTVRMPEKKGDVWFAGCYDGGMSKFTPVGEVYSGRPNTSTRAKIAAELNLLEQFDVIDETVFSESRKIIDEVKENYLSRAGEEKLNEYYGKIKELREKLENGLVMENIEANGKRDQLFGSFEKDHSLGSIFVGTDTLSDFKVNMKSVGATWNLEKIEENYRYYRLVLKNGSLGVSTNYYLNIYKSSTSTNPPIENWVEDIDDPGNTEFDIYYKDGVKNGYAQTCGGNAELGRDLKITLMKGVKITSMEYAADAEDGDWKYDVDISLILHLEKESTGEKGRFSVYYRPIGAELTNIKSTNNRILGQKRLDSCSKYSDSPRHYLVRGTNKEMGEGWIAEVSKGATYTLSEPSGNQSYKQYDLVTLMTITNPNGATRTYYIYYEQDTSDAEIIGIYDPDNMYTYYYENGATSTNGGIYYQISVEGVNSELGENLKVATKPGAEAEIEYTVGAVSWDKSSDARITVTARNGAKRIYYVNYRKSSVFCGIKSIRSSSNVLKKVYLSWDELKITGSASELVEDSLEIQMRQGYTANISRGTLTVKEDATGIETSYDIKYTQDGSGITVFGISDADNKYAYTRIDSYSTSLNLLNYDDSANRELVRVIYVNGENAQLGDNYTLDVPYGSTVAGVIHKGEDGWNYTDRGKCIYYKDKETGEDVRVEDYYEYTDRVIVRGADGSECIYVIAYAQDSRGAMVQGISDAENKYAYTQISDSLTDLCLKASDDYSRIMETVQVIYVEGQNVQLGNTYSIDIPNGSVIVSSIHNGEEGWNYSETYSKWYKGDDWRQYDYYEYTDRIVVRASNGTERTYVIAYARDKSGAAVHGISDAGNKYVHTQVDDTYTELEMISSDGKENSEKVRMIYVKGGNGRLGDTYVLDIPDGSVITSVTHRDEKEWKYNNNSKSHSYTDEKTGDKIEDFYVYADRIVVRAANGVECVYVIAYASDVSSWIVRGISDESNRYAHTKIDIAFSKEVETVSSDGGYSSEWVHMIYVVGDNVRLGNTYTLDIPEGSTIAGTLHKGEEGWNYRYNGENMYYKDEETGETIRDYYEYTDRVVVRAADGMEDVYIIAYARNDTDVVVRGISDEENRYTCTEIDSYNRELDLISSVGGSTHEVVRMIYVKGDNAQLGDTYFLDIPDGSTIVSTIHKGGEGWNYLDNGTEHNYVGEDRYTVRGYFEYTDRVVVRAANGMERIYVIAYGKNNDDAVVDGISDEENNYIHIKIENAIVNTRTSYARWYETVNVIYINGSNAQLGNTYTLDIPDGSVIASTIHKDDEGWNYSDKGTSHQYKDEKTGMWLEDYYEYTDRIVVRASNGAERIYVIAYAKNSSDAVVSGISDAGNKYARVNIESNTTSLPMTQKSSFDGSLYEKVCMIYVEGYNAQLGNTYTLDIPDGSVIAGVTHRGDKGWNYSEKGKTYRHYSYEEYEDKIVYYEYMDRVVVRAPNGAERIYIIAYAKSRNEAAIHGISDNGNKYTYTRIEDNFTLHKMNPTGLESHEDVRVIFVRGMNAQLGNNYTLDIPDGSTIVSTIRKGEKEWNYIDSHYISGYETFTGIIVYDPYEFTDRVVVRAANGTERIYVIAYARETRGTIVLDISDVGNKYVHTQISSETTYFRLKTPIKHDYDEDVYVIYVKGNNAHLGDEYVLDIPNGGRVISTIHNGDEGWNYLDSTEFHSYEDEETGETVKDNYEYADRVVVRDPNGLERIYVIAYVQDTSGTVVRGISDAENMYTHIGINTEYLSFTSSDGSYFTEYVKMIYISGGNKQLGDTYVIDIPDSSTIADTIHKGDVGWKYSSGNIIHYYKDEETGEGVTDFYELTERIVVRAASGAEQVYVIAYVQDLRGTVVRGISDAENEYLHSQITDHESSLGFLGGGYEKVRMIYVKGYNAQLGNTYSLDIPDGSTVVGTIHKGDEGWKYSSDSMSHYYKDEETGEGVTDHYELTDRIVVRAANGAEQVYVIAYAQDLSGTVVRGISDAENKYLHSQIDDYELSLWFGGSDEKVRMIYVKGYNAQLGSTYSLDIPDGSTVVSTIHKGDEGWKYFSSSAFHYYRDEETGEIVEDYYEYTDRVVVRAPNGAERIYVIAYVQDTGGSE